VGRFVDGVGGTVRFGRSWQSVRDQTGPFTAPKDAPDPNDAPDRTHPEQLQISEEQTYYSP